MGSDETTDPRDAEIARLREEVETLHSERRERIAEWVAQAQELAAARADNAALRGTLKRCEEIAGNVEEGCEFHTYRDDILQAVSAALATPAPGAPWIDAVRGLVAAVERMTRREEFPANIGGPLTIHRVEFSHDAEGVEATSCHICAALAAVRAALGDGR